MPKWLKMATVVGWIFMVMFFVVNLILIYPPNEVTRYTWFGVEYNNGRN